MKLPGAIEPKRGWLALALIAGCSTASGGGPPDAAVNGPDSGAPADAASSPDAFAVVDAPPSIPDAPSTPDAPPLPDAPPPIPDAAPLPDATPGICDPVAQTGCSGGQKCTWNNSTMATVCTSNGNITTGGACSYVAGIDNCTAGNQCINGVCSEICSTSPETCPSGDNCTLISMTFDDLLDIGVCQSGCDPLNPNCATGEGCYLGLTTGNSICFAPTATAGAQGQACPNLNSCIPGHGCLLNDDPVSPTGLTCAFYCDSNAGGGPSCTDPGGPGSAYQCCEIRTFYTNSGNVPAGIGMCVETAVWGACPS